MSADGLGDARWRAGLRRRLLAWYRRHRRDLPWRRTADPYSIWVSEVMLQQTRVETARGYYERFLARYPTVEALAAAEEGEVLKAWEGMGYYSRARNLHRAARTVVGEHGGRLPGTYDGLLDLPGVGPYTAAAVSSIAFDRPHPVLDGNVTRLLCRLLRVEDDPRRAPVRARLIAAGEALMPRSRPGDFNQAPGSARRPTRAAATVRWAPIAAPGPSWTTRRCCRCVRSAGRGPTWRWRRA